MSWEDGVAAVKAGDYSTAFREFLVLAYQGNPAAQYNIGYMNEMGNGIPVNYPHALEWYGRAANRGHRGAEYRIGLMYEIGQGIKQDLTEARKWYVSATQKGNQLSMEGLKRIDMGKGGMVPSNPRGVGTGIKVSNSSDVTMLCNLTDSLEMDKVEGGLVYGNIVGETAITQSTKQFRRNGTMVFNNIRVDNSVIGTINTGNVQAIDVSLTHLHQAGNDQARDALKALTEAILNDTSMTKAQKGELIEQVAFLSEQTTVQPEKRKPGLIKPTLSALTQAAGTVSSIAGAWQAAAPILKSVLGGP
jgi:TPR repeat protein